MPEPMQPGLCKSSDCCKHCNPTLVYDRAFQELAAQILQSYTDKVLQRSKVPDKSACKYLHLVYRLRTLQGSLEASWGRYRALCGI